MCAIYTAIAPPSPEQLTALAKDNEGKTYGEHRCTLGRKAGSATLVFEQFTRRPLLGAPQLARQLSLSPLTVRNALGELGKLGLLNEITGQRRNRLWLYQDYYGLLSEGAAPL